MANANFSVLPFYDSLSKQKWNKPWNYGKSFQLISNNRRVLPFVLKTPTSFGNILTIKIVNFCDGTEIDAKDEMYTTGMGTTVYAAYKLHTYPSYLNFPSIDLGEGSYYVEISDGSTSYYSEVFIATNTHQYEHIYSKIEFWSEVNIEWNGGLIDYTYPFRNYYYFKAIEGVPDYEIEEEGEERDGYFFAEKQIRKKFYNLFWLMPEYVFDVVTLIGMHTHIRIYHDGEIYHAQSFEFRDDWQDYGGISATRITFSVDDVVKVIGRKYPLIEGGDYDTSYDDSFNNE